MKVIIAIAIFCAAFALTLLLRRSEAEEPGRTPVKHISAEQAAEMLAAAHPNGTAYTILDVRTTREYAAGHIEGALNIDIKQPDFAEKIAAMTTAYPVIVHCRSGARSQRALPELQKLTLPGLYHLDGGILAWQKAGLPVTE